MRRALWFILYALLALAAWTSIPAAGAYEGWWHRPLARSGDTRAFQEAAIAELDKPDQLEQQRAFAHAFDGGNDALFREAAFLAKKRDQSGFVRRASLQVASRSYFR